MPKPFTPTERIERAESLIAQAAEMVEPASGPQRSGWMKRRISTLARAERWLNDRFATTKFGSAHQAKIAELQNKIETLWPKLK